MLLDEIYLIWYMLYKITSCKTKKIYTPWVFNLFITIRSNRITPVSQMT